MGNARKQDQRNEKTSFGIVEAKSIKTIDTAEEKGYDTVKKVSGIKLHIVVDIYDRNQMNNYTVCVVLSKNIFVVYYKQVLNQV